MNEVLAITLQSMQLDMARLERIGHNQANAQTTGYRREIVSAMSFGQRVDAADSAQATASASAPTTHVDTRIGSLRHTGQSLDLALGGPGWFEVRTEQGAAYTRRGDFRLDAQGRLVTQQGHPLMGQAGEIQLTNARPVIDLQGRVFDAAQAGATSLTGAAPVAQIKIVQFAHSTPAQRLGDSLLRFSGEPQSAAPDGRVELRQGYLENANVSSLQEMVQMMQTLRHFESMQKAALGYDEMLGAAIRKLGDAA